MTQRFPAAKGSSECLRSQRTSGSLEWLERNENALSTNGELGRPRGGERALEDAGEDDAACDAREGDGDRDCDS